MNRSYHILNLILFLALTSYSGSATHGMSYLNNLYNTAVNYWYGNPETMIENFINKGQSEQELAKILALAATSQTYAQKLAKLCAEHIVTLSKYSIGCRLLITLLQYEQIAQILASACAENENLVTLSKSSDSCELLKVIAKDKESAQTLASAFIEHFIALSKAPYTEDFFWLLSLAKNNDIAQALIPACAQNIVTLSQSEEVHQLFNILADHKDFTQILASACTEHFVILSNSQDGLNLLASLAEHKSIAQILVPLYAQNITRLSRFGRSPYLLDILAKHKDFTQILASACTEHFVTLSGSANGLDLLTKLAEHKNIAQILAPLCAQNITQLSRFFYGRQLLDILADHKDFAQILAPACAEHIITLNQSLQGSLFLASLAEHKNIAQILAPLYAQNIITLSRSFYGRKLFRILAENKESAQTLAHAYAQHIITFGQSDEDVNLVTYLTRYTEAVQILASACIENFEALFTKQESRNLLANIARHNKSLQLCLHKKIKERYGITISTNQAPLPTPTHLLQHIPLGDSEIFYTNPQLQPLLKAVLAKEQELQDHYYTFVHGQRRELYMPEKIYTLLWQLKNNRSVQDFFFAHVKDPVKSPEDITSDKIQKQFILSHGNYDIRPDVQARLKLLFMNYALFANAGNHGSNSAYYIVNNTNSPAGRTYIDISPLAPFKMFGYQAVCDQLLKRKIEALDQEYKDAGKYGNLLFIAVPKEKIHKYVYLADIGGPKRSIEIEGIGKTSDIRLIMDTLLHEPHKIKDTDQLEFCLIMMQRKGGLDPDTGIKIWPMLSGDPEKLAELKKKEDALLAEIKQKVIDFEYKDQMQTKAYERATAILNHIK